MLNTFVTQRIAEDRIGELHRSAAARRQAAAARLARTPARARLGDLLVRVGTRLHGPAPEPVAPRVPAPRTPARALVSTDGRCLR